MSSTCKTFIDSPNNLPNHHEGPTEESEASADQLLRLHKCHLLHSQGKSDEFIVEARKLLSYSFPGQFSPQFIRGNPVFHPRV